MKYVIMVSHGEFAPGLHSAVEMMTGKRDDVLSTSLSADMGTPEFIENFKKLIEPITEDDEIILLADILSGSPFTSSLSVLDEKGMMGKTTVFAGMNMPLAVSAVLMKDNMDGDILKESLLSEGQVGLCIFEQVSDDSDDDI